MTYETLPGTIPHRAIEFLKKHPGEEFTSSQLSEAIDCMLDGFTTCMKPARQHGLVKARYKDGDVIRLHWSLGGNTPLPKPEDHEPDEPLQPAPAKPRVTDALVVPKFGDRPASKWLTAQDPKHRPAQVETIADPAPAATEPELSADAEAIKAIAKAAEKPAVKPMPELVRIRTRNPFRVGYFSDGSLSLEFHDGGGRTIDPSEVQKLRDFLATVPV